MLNMETLEPTKQNDMVTNNSNCKVSKNELKAKTNTLPD